MRMRVLTLVMAGVFATGAAASAESVSPNTALAPDLVAALADPGLREDAIEQDIRYRLSFALDARRERVEYLYDHPEETVGTRFAGALLTVEEWTEMRIRNQLEYDAQLVDEYYRHTVAREDYGGLRIDHDAGGVLAVYVRRGAARPWEAEVQHRERLEIRDALISWDRLMELQTWVLAASQGDARAASVTDARLDLDRGEVVVGFEPPALAGLVDGELPAGFAEALGRDHLRAEPVERPRDTPAYVAGNRYHNSATSDAQYCSFGFKVLRAGSSDSFALGAGHCVDEVTDPVYRNTSPNNTRVGEYRKKKFHDGSWGEVALIRFDSGYSVAPRVKHILSGTAYQLDVEGLNTSYTLGATRCLTGSKGGTECGPITGIDVDSHYVEEDWTIQKLIKLGNADDPVVPMKGDSGGPVYSLDLDRGVVRAAGIFVSLGPDCPDVCRYGKFTKLSSIPSDWEVTIAIVEDPVECIPGEYCLLDDSDDDT